MGNNFGYLDELIRSGFNEIVLDCDIVLGEDEESKYLQGIEIDADDLIVDGNGHSIDAREKTRIFRCSGRNVQIKNITFKNGFSKDNGGAIYNAADLAIMNSQFIENKTKCAGGAIYNCKGNLTITKSEFNDNTSSYYNPNSDGEGGAICNDKGILMVEESSFTGNASANGASIMNRGQSTLVNSIFAKNEASGDGGALFNNYGCVLSVVNSIFVSNKANWDGGVIFNDNDAILSIADSTFNLNISYNHGGAIFNGKGTLNIEGSTLLANVAEHGGALNNDGGKAILNKAAFTKNSARNGNGGAIYNNREGLLNISESSLEDNRAIRDGGAIFVMDGDLTIVKSILNDNMANWNGGAIYNIRSSLKVQESTVSKNIAQEGGGGAIYTRKAEFTIESSTFADNFSRFNVKPTDWNGVVIHIGEEFTKREWFHDLIQFD